MAACFWGAASATHTHVWLEYVETEANAAGPPARMRPAFGGKRGRLKIANKGFPSSFYREMRSHVDLVSAAKRYTAAERGMVSAFTRKDDRP